MKTHHAAALSILALFLCSTVSAKDEGIYIGASMGAAKTGHGGSNPSRGEFDIDDTVYAYKLFGGYQFSPIFALEGGYRDLGEPSSRSARTSIEGFDVFAVAGVPAGPLRLFGKLGAMYRDTRTLIRENGTELSDSGLGLAAGAGLEFELGSLALRGEIEYLDALDGAWMYTVGGTFTF